MNLLNSTLPGPVEPPPPDPNASRCHLLGTTGIIVQLIMGLLVMASLVVKRQFERRKRKWRIWVWDVGKQLCGQAVVHGLNLLISNVVADAANNNPCSLYFLNILIDTTVGVLIFYVTLKALTWYLSEKLGREGFVSGQYGNPPKPLFWWRQLVPYLLSMIFMKLLVVLPLTLPGISTALLRFGHAMLEYLSPSVQIVFVMAVFPVIMNIIQFCIFDQIIKAGKGDAPRGEDDDGDKEDEDDDDDEGGYRRVPTRDIESSPRQRRRDSSSNTRKDRGVSSSRASTPAPMPRSPLLEPSMSNGSPQKGYGSTSPSPSPRPSGDGVGAGGTFWQNMLHASGSRSAASVSTSTSPQDSRLGTSTTARDDWRSGAPSPESYRPPPTDPDTSIPQIDLSPHSERSTSPPPSASMHSSAHSHFGHVSRLSEDQGREARKQLSPRSQTSMMSFAEPGVGMKDLPA